MGRDTERLDEAGVARAAVETVAENTSDGVVAPLFFLALGGAPLGFFYKAVNTMDSMLGYVEPPYRNIGLVPAKMDDVLNFLPARLAALLMLAAGGLLGLDVGGGWAYLPPGPGTTTPVPIPRRPSRSARGCWVCAWRGTHGTTACGTKSPSSATNGGRSSTRISPGPAG